MISKVDFWDEVVSEGENQWSYSTKPYSLPSFSKTLCTYCDRGWITDLISQNSLYNLRPETPIFISAQTGSGKTTLIFKECLPLAQKENKRILYLCSRAALAAQVKKIAMTDPSNKLQKVNDIYIKDFCQYFTPQYINESIKYGLIDILTYHSYFKLKKQIDADDYSMVVLDECHFFVSDSKFNPFTEAILNSICKKFSGTRRMYLTATPQECIDQIYEYETSSSRANSNMLILFHFKERYDFLDPYFFFNENKLISTIKERSTEEKWLIFVSSKKQGNQLLNIIKEFDNDTIFFCSETEKDNTDLCFLIEEEILSKRIVISTRLIDVGVNVRTNNLNVVLFEYEQTELKQMIGRKRIKGNEKLRVYFHVPDPQMLKKRSTCLAKSTLDYYDAKRRLKHNIPFESIALPLFISDGKLSINKLTLTKLNYERDYFRMLNSAWLETRDNNDFLNFYIKLIASFFPGMAVSDKICILETFQERLDKLLSNIIAKELTQQEYIEVTRHIVNILGEWRKNSTGIMRVNNLNSRLQKYGYAFRTNDTKSSYFVEPIEIGG